MVKTLKKTTIQDEILASSFIQNMSKFTIEQGFIINLLV
jgi:hypothetical protein